MRESLSLGDVLAISAYLDDRLDQAASLKLESRLNEDTLLKRAFLEIQHTRKLLRSLPSRRAPRNFTLTQEAAGRRARRWGIQAYFGLASATAALALVMVAGVNLFAPRTSLKAAPPQAAMLQSESAMEANAPSAAAATDAQATPLIFNWSPQGQAYGMGGGSGGGGDTAAFEPKALSSQDGPAGSTEPGAAEPMIAESAADDAASDNSEATVPEAPSSDPSTLILGLPEPGTEGEVTARDMVESTPALPALPPSTLWMAGLGAAALLFAGLALILHRR